jgi:hypothetical protein
MDAVVADVHIAAPLDALAAWWSNLVLGRVLLHAIGRQLEPSAGRPGDLDDDDLSEDLQGDLRLALRTAPPPSAARVRALVAQAVLVDRHRALNIAQAAAALPRLAAVAEPVVPAEDSLSDPSASSPVECGASSPHHHYHRHHPVAADGRQQRYAFAERPATFFVRDAPAPGDVRAALALARCLALASPAAEAPSSLSVFSRSPSAAARARKAKLRHAAALANGAATAVAPGAFSLLSLAAALLLLRRFGARRALKTRAAPGLERLAGAVRVWVGAGGGDGACCAGEDGLGTCEGAEACGARGEAGAGAARVPEVVREAAVRCCVGLGRRAAGAADDVDEADEGDSGYGSGEARRLARGGKAAVLDDDDGM